MLFNSQTILLAIATLLGTPAVTTFLVRKFGKSAPVVVATVENAAKDALHVFEDLATSPWFAGKVVAGKVEAHHVNAVLTETKLADEAKEILVSIGTEWSSLSEDQRVKAGVLLRLAFSSVGITLTDKQIQDTFSAAQTAINDTRASDVYKAMFVANEPTAQPSA